MKGYVRPRRIGYLHLLANSFDHVCKGEASDPSGGALCFPLSRRLEALDLVLTILLDVPHRRRQIVSERNYINKEKEDGLTWMVRSGDDVARDGLETPDTCTKDCPGCVSRGRSLRCSSQNQEKEIVRNLRKSRLSYREVLKGEQVGYNRNYPPKSPPSSPPLMRWAIYILGICTQGLNGHFSW